MHKQVDSNYKLIYSSDLPENVFKLNEKHIEIKCCFQVWINNKIDIENNFNDLRIKTSPPIKHTDFEMFLYNNTKNTIKFFNEEKYKWDFAVHRQGYYDYNDLIFDEKKLIENRQYIFFKAKNKKILKKLQEINFEKLSKNNTTVPGFGKADIINEYINISRKEKNEKNNIF